MNCFRRNIQNPAAPVRVLFGYLFRFRGLMDWLAGLKMRASSHERWGINNPMYITKTATPMDATDALLRFNEENQHPDLVKQDILILIGAEDHFIPLKMHDKQVNALKNARSVTARIFTREDQAQNHCQVGNTGLAPLVMLKWIGEKSYMETGEFSGAEFPMNSGYLRHTCAFSDIKPA